MAGSMGHSAAMVQHPCSYLAPSSFPQWTLGFADTILGLLYMGVSSIWGNDMQHHKGKDWQSSGWTMGRVRVRGTAGQEAYRLATIL